MKRFFISKKNKHRNACWAWCAYDWANSAFSTVIVTFVFSAYFTKNIAAGIEEGTGLWGLTLSLSAIVIAILSPVLGAAADQKMQRKKYLASLTAICVICTSLLWFVEPNHNRVILALVLFALANVSFEIGVVFYNSLLPSLVSKTHLGRLSGWGWGIGYAGGLAALVIVLFFFIKPSAATLGLDRDTAEHIRIVGPIVAIWFAVFSLPLFIFVSEKKFIKQRPSSWAIGLGLKSVFQTFNTLKKGGPLARFLIARLFYIDGLNTLFAFGGIYAVGTFGMTFENLIIFGVAMNISAGLGSVFFSWIDDYFGSRETVLVSIFSVFILGIPLLVISSIELFWVFALLLGLFVGPAQSASRTILIKLAPNEKIGEMFGLFALSGRITSFLGPSVLALSTLALSSQRAGMASILVFLVIGGAILMTVKIK